MHASSNRPFSLQEKTSMLVQTDQMVQLWLLTRKTERIENNLNLILKKTRRGNTHGSSSRPFFQKENEDQHASSNRSDGPSLAAWPESFYNM
jgi:hypothetical protein